MTLLVLAVPALLVMSSAVLTGVGARRRGAGWTVAILSAAFFPVAWAAWYVRDTRGSRPSVGPA